MKGIFTVFGLFCNLSLSIHLKNRILQLEVQNLINNDRIKKIQSLQLASNVITTEKIIVK